MLSNARTLVFSARFWRGLFIASGALAVAVAALVLAVSAFLVALPLALVGSVALHFHVNRQLRRGVKRSGPAVIDGEYTVVSGV